jgi:phosphomannomutase
MTSSDAELPQESLRARLTYEPQILRFGTSGRRGEVVHLTQLEVYINALGELEYLKSLSPEEGGIREGEEFFLAYDLRPSSTTYVPDERGRGEIAQAIVQAISDAGLKPVNLGSLPTPALTCYALARGKGSIMVTGSHIPFDRNGYKTNTSEGELLKKHEEPVNAEVENVRNQEYARPFSASLFDTAGRLKSGHRDLPDASDAGRLAYIDRYCDFFARETLHGMRLLCYQHSAVGRDLLVQLLERLGAEVIPAGRSETFIPIDTENIEADQLAAIQQLANDVAGKFGPIDAVVSTDGDSDRPLLLDVDAGTGQVHFFGGDLLGMVVAEYLGADAVVVPVSCNDGIDYGKLAQVLEPKTKIGSPFVIAGMERALAKGCKRVCGWEANGGFLTGSDIDRNGRTLKALPTRDAVLPLLGALFASREKRMTLVELFGTLPRRFSRAALLKNFPRSVGAQIVARFSPADDRIENVVFEQAGHLLMDPAGNKIDAPPSLKKSVESIRANLQRFFTPDYGFGPIARLNYTDGVRITFESGEVAHMRPSGNADELRIYAVADSLARAEAITAFGIAEPNGILRSLERFVKYRSELQTQ